MSDIERIPSMRKPARQGVPRKPKPQAKQMARPDARPAAKPAPTREAPAVEPVAPPARDAMPAMPVEEVDQAPVLALEPAPVWPETIIEKLPSLPPEPAPVSPEPSPAPPAAQATQPAQPRTPPVTLRAVLQSMDGAFAAFRAAVLRFPGEHMDDHLSEDGWTRKQMLAHIAAWHDLTADRLVKLMLTGRPVELDRDDDAINAAVARQAVGKTAGEVLKDVEATFNRLRRQASRLTDAQLHAADDWAVHVVAGNTWKHYADHLADLTPPEPPPGSAPRR